MSFFDRFKKNEPPKKPAPAKAKGQKLPAKKAETSVAAEAKPKTVREELEQVHGKPKKGIIAGVYAHRVLLKPIISEKSTFLHGFNQYVFKVAPGVNKIMVKKAIYEAYHSEPYEIKIMNVRGKKVVRGKIQGTRSSYKKAIVTMPKGTTLPIYEGV